MAIPQLRAKFLREDTNVATIDYTKITDNGVFNLLANASPTLTKDIESFLKNNLGGKLDDLKNTLAGKTSELQQKINEEAKALSDQIETGFNNTVNDLKSSLKTSELFKKLGFDGLNIDTSGIKVRNLLGGLGSMFNFDGLNLTDLKKVKDLLFKTASGAGIGGLSSSNATAAAGLFNQLSGNCQTGGLNLGLPGNLFDIDANCGGGNANCSDGKISDIINKLTNGEYQNAYSNLNALLRTLVNMTNLSYNNNLCSAYNALEKSILGSLASNTTLVGVGVSAILQNLTNTSNTNGIYNFANNVNERNINVNLYNPSATSDIVNAYITPTTVKEQYYREYGDETLNMLNKYNKDYSSSSYDNTVSVASVNKSYNDDMYKVASSVMYDEEFDFDRVTNYGLPDSTVWTAGFGCLKDYVDPVSDEGSWWN